MPCRLFELIREGVTAPRSSARRAFDRFAWSLAWSRYREFSGTESLIRRERHLDIRSVDTGNERCDQAFRAFLTRPPELEYFVGTRVPGVIEPRHGYVLLSTTRVLFHALSPRSVLWPRARASISRYVSAMSRAHDLLEFDQVVSLRNYHELNLWHLVNDIFPKLLLAEEAGVPRNVPAVVGHRLACTAYFKDVLPILEKFRPIVVQPKDEYIRARVVYCGETLNDDGAPFDRFLDELDATDSLPPRTTEDGAHTRVFVTRSSARARAVVNVSELHSICAASGFEVVDFDDLSFRDARLVTASADTIVGFHGAGLTNMMFRRGRPTRVGEILMESWIAPEYFLLARHFGFAYRAMLGREAGETRQEFLVDPGAFEDFLRKVTVLPATCTPRAEQPS